MIKSGLKKRSALSMGALLFGLLVVWSAGPARAESSETAPPGYHIGGKYLKNIVLDFKDVVVSPAHWKGKSWLLFGGTAAVSRLHDMEHWASDVFVGSVLGYFIGKMVRHLNSPRGGGSARPSVGFGPAGFSISFQF